MEGCAEQMHEFIGGKEFGLTRSQLLAVRTLRRWARAAELVRTPSLAEPDF